MYNSHLLEIKLPVSAKIKPSKYGLTMPKETPSPSRLTARPFDQSITRTTDNSFLPHQMIRLSKSTKSKTKRTYSP